MTSRSEMRVLIACEYSGRVRDAFIAFGHDALSCDLLPTEQPGPHHQGDVRDLLGDGGHGETKATCLWLKGLPTLQPTNVVAGREARVHRMPPSPDRWKERSRTYRGIAAAMAQQWGSLPSGAQGDMFRETAS